MVAQAARRADDDVRAVVELAALLRGIHAADAGGDARAGGTVEPDQLAADLQREFAGGGDDQRERLAGRRNATVLAEQLGMHGQAEGHGLSGAGLGGDDKVASGSFGFNDGGLDGRGRGITTRRERFGEKRREHGLAKPVSQGKRGLIALGVALCRSTEGLSN
jgi:hypothetical protein